MVIRKHGAVTGSIIGVEGEKAPPSPVQPPPPAAASHAWEAGQDSEVGEEPADDQDDA